MIPFDIAANRTPTAPPERPLICALGDLNLDVIVIPEVQLVRDADTPATIRLAAGGQAANVAAWACALGARGRLVCARGSGQAAGLAAAELRAWGVEICGPLLAGSGGVVVSTREPDGGRTMASAPGVAGQLSPDALDPEWISTADVLHISGYSLLRQPAAEAAIAAARLARRVTVDLASAHDIERFGRDRFAKLVRALGPELVFANQAERAAVPDLEVAWVIKRGPRGATFPEGEFASEAAAVVDTTGAGDALAAGYLVGGAPLAMAAAARCVANIGALPPSGDFDASDTV